jgi:hypothetical protein
MIFTFVTAIYNVYENERAGYIEELWDRLAILAATVPLRVVCDPADADRVKALGAVPHPVPFQGLATYAVLQKAPHLPARRNPVKDTRDFMILMNAKTECLNIVRNEAPSSTHYIWIDAGITKIFTDPTRTLTDMMLNIGNAPRDQILIPGCWDSRAELDALTQAICWRFCGGFFVVPEEHVQLFAATALDACESIRLATGLAIWEVNIWAMVEPRLPIQWTRGDHNETIFDGLGARRE